MRTPTGWLRDRENWLTRDDERFSIVREGRGRWVVLDWRAADPLEAPPAFGTRKAAVAAAEGIGEEMPGP